MSYFEKESTFERKEDLGEGCSPTIESHGEDLRIDDNYCNNPTCFESSLLLTWEVLLRVMKQNIVKMWNLYKIILIDG